MASIEIRAFGGMQPSANPKNMSETAAVLVRNLDLRYGDFRPLPVAENMNNPMTAGQTLYRLQNTGYFITNPGIVNYVRGPIPNDSLERTYYTGDGVPKVVTQMNQVRQLGVPAPTSAPVVQVNVTDEYSTDDAAADQAKKLAEMVTAVRSSYTWPFVGLSDADLGPRFIPNINEPAKWSYSLKIPGVLAGGVFTPTNPSHNNLLDDRLHYHLETINGVDVGLVDLDVRGQKIHLVADDMTQKLAAITDPSNAAKKLLNADQILTIKTTLVDALTPLDTAYNQGIDRLRDLKAQYIALADGGSVSAAANLVAVKAFYQRAEVLAAIDSGLEGAVDSIYAAFFTYNNPDYVTNPTTGGKTHHPDYYYHLP
jgi:hypothetical protein